jgi:hypothetical protein
MRFAWRGVVFCRKKEIFVEVRELFVTYRGLAVIGKSR